jgi:23S rRNA pseudouridine2605 synthase
MRIQKFIAECGVCSRRAAEELVAAGKIMVNGSVAEIGMDVDPENDRVLYSGKRIYIKATEKQYFIFYKPRGVITSMKRESEDEKRAIVADFIKRIKGRVYPVGRLDRDSEGILILTDDGEAALRMTHPRYHVNKTYRVTVRGDFSESQLEKLRTVFSSKTDLLNPQQLLFSLRRLKRAKQRIRIFMLQTM